MTAPGPAEALTPEELEVVALVGDGLTNEAIARELGLSDSTVKRRLHCAALKLGTFDRAGMVGAAVRTGQLRVPVTGVVPNGFTEALWLVLVGVARGQSTARIATDLMISEHTVKSRIQRLYRLLGVQDRPSVVRAGFACGALTLVPRRPVQHPADVGVGAALLDA